MQREKNQIGNWLKREKYEVRQRRSDLFEFQNNAK